MSPVIQRLRQKVINQIAAGEVIENPASVVKELIENSLDAGAKEIEITLLSGGQGRIRVADNGRGIARDEAPLALEAHTTSKLIRPEDLAHISTMGFRGEALASISSVSRFSLETSQGGEGIRLSLEGGENLRSEPVVREAGTEVTVDDLFFNAPVRKKFQKTPASDTAQVRKIVNLLALAYPEVGFTLRQGEEVLLRVSSLPFPFQEAFRERVEGVFGKGFSQEAIAVDDQKEGIRVRGFIGSPTFTRPSRARQALLLNRRSVVSPLISQAVMEAFSTRLSQGRHPVFALHIDMPTDHLDVNVHPQKREVRFQKEEEIKQVVIAAISKALEGNQVETYALPKFCDSYVSEERVPFAPFNPVSLPTFSLPIQPQMLERPIHIFGFLSEILMLEPLGPYAKEEGLLLVHTKRARARIEFERLLSSLKEGFLSSQMLAIPAVIELLPSELDQVKACKAALQKLGIEVRPFGGSTAIIESLPSLLQKEDPKGVLEKLLSALTLKGAWEEAAAKEAVRMAPHSTLTLDQAASFIREWLTCREPIRCPHGQPVCSMMSLETILGRF